ncbi:MAG: esterase/lipase family protein [Candidatus Xenobia bacterium]
MIGSIASKPPGWFKKQQDGARFVRYGAVYKAEEALTEAREKKHQPLSGLPGTTISTPFVLVPGWTTQPEAFGPLVQYLTKDGANGGQAYFVKQGAIYTMDSSGNLKPAPSVPSNAKVFEMIFSNVHASPNHQVVEMRQNFRAIQKATGAAQVDAEAYSMGGLDARVYVDEGGKAIRRLLLLGTPNNGTGFGPLAETVINEDVQWAEKFGGIEPGDAESLQWLSPPDQSKQLADLNSRWDKQRSALPILTVGANLLPTPKPGGGFVGGDGLVPASSLQMPNSECIVVDDAMLHGRLNDDATVQHLRAIWFDWPMPAPTEHQDLADRVRNQLKNWNHKTP